MRLLSLTIIFITFLSACTSDDVIKSEKEALWGIVKKITKKSPENDVINQSSAFPKNKKWLQEFKQPIILTSSTDKKNQATLVALGNNEERLTWVSADGISLSYDSGILIATRGYSQDLLSLSYENPKNIFSSSYLKYDKTHRYISGENRHHDIGFKCTGRKKKPQSIKIVEYNLLVDKYVETCVNARHKYTNEYYLLSGTTVVVKSKQWISPTNSYFLTYNLYAFQKF